MEVSPIVLNLLSPQEYVGEKSDSISDPVMKALPKAHEGKNKLHDATPFTVQSPFLESAFFSFVAPILKNFDCLKIN